ncbi:sigma-54-dependent Fis family transcriptional regulator [Melaminivora suipulveris]|uniref:Sigma-54-dependent Fis family transcriptional regulator n=1 Tax=Melaminivora suipulveris TaxID=2109913 RepID=A0A2R3QBN0_9BURK|nr:sigma-54-dependent Fis family transcriptional regulator [Melaminivora suipulveris]AVO49193.1 sigma-54-dependent Fis family transcriptional regulator [Melaminivora suipulveris]
MTSLPALPSDADLRRQVQFSSTDGRIWLAGQRMVLMHAGSLGILRRELVQTLGREGARRMLLRVGYASGERDAALAHQLRAGADAFARFAVGPQLHMLEGAVQVTPELLEIDAVSGHYHGIFRWNHSWEVETHLRDFGTQHDPVCWTLLGYASGYTSAFMGRQILYKEVACHACGAPHCRIEGRPMGDWPDGAQLVADYAPGALTPQPAPGAGTPAPAWPAPAEDQPATAADALGQLIGRSAAFTSATQLLRKAAGTQVTVLLGGETGVGKERFARALHALSPRAAKPFVAVNCAALPGELIESELFGTEKGAYTGADAARAGRFERAHGGTLFLDELGELSLPAQAKLLRVLQEGEVERLGAKQTRQVDVRLVCATHIDLAEAVRAGRFRQDLYYRLNVYPIRIPPLRERPEDIEPFARHLLERFARVHDKHVPGFTDRALAALRQHGWPGNVREMENLVERGVILADAGQPLDVGQLFPEQVDGPAGSATHTLQASGRLRAQQPPAFGEALIGQLLSRPLDLQRLETQLIEEAVARSQGNLAAAARLLGLTRPQLSYRLNKIRSE